MPRRLSACIMGPRRLTFELAGDDVVVFVVGPSGAGKSLFVYEATKADMVNVDAGLRPCTTKVQAIRCGLADEARAMLGVQTQKNIVFVDTPSFHTGRNDEAAEREMRNWLSSSKSKSTLVGIIYMHRVETNPSDEPIQKHLDTFVNTFPQNFVSIPRRVHAILSTEGWISEDKITARKASFKAQLDSLHPSLAESQWVTSLHPELFRSGASETAWQAVVALFTGTAGGA